MVQADFVLAHNDIDKEYYEGLLEKPTFINPTLMVEDPINVDLLTDLNDRKGTIIGGNLVDWYGGFNSLMVANESGEKVYAPQMGRMDKLELQIEEIHHLPYLQWDQWMIELSKFKYAVHLNPNTIGGTFYLNCAYLGIPCIGNINTNTQRVNFPDLSVQPGDLQKAKKLIRRLKEDRDFYKHVSTEARSNYKEHFSEEQYKNTWQNIIKTV